MVRRAEKGSDVDSPHERSVFSDVDGIGAFPRLADELVKDGSRGVFRATSGNLFGRDAPDRSVHNA